MPKRVRIQTVNLTEGQAMDVFTPASGRTAAPVLLWHGSGPRERTVLSPLAAAVAELDRTVFVPDWSSDSEDRGVGDLLRSLGHVFREADRYSSPRGVVLAGWSAGASAAMAVALEDAEHRPVSTIAIAGRYDVRGPLGEYSAMTLAKGARTSVAIHLVHGSRDSVVPAEQTSALFDTLTTTGSSATLTLVDTDHAGAIGCRYDEERMLCVPATDPHTRAILERVAALFDTDM